MKCISFLKYYNNHKRKPVYYELGATFSQGLVEKIKHHKSLGEGDQHYCEVYFENGNKLIIYRPDEVEFEKGDKND